MFASTTVYASQSVASSINTGIVNQASPRSPINTTMSTLSTMESSSQQVNIYSGYTSEPAPMGIADYGIGPNGAYQYNTSSFIGIVTINSLATRNSTNDPSMGIQLNVNLAFTTSNGKQYVYWIQDVAFIDTSTNHIGFENNIWNFSATSAGLSSSGIRGNGQVYNSSRGGQYYAVGASSSLPGSEIFLQYPATLILNVTCGVNIGGQPTVSFAYDDGYGLVTYDTTTFIASYPVTSFTGFVVNGYNYNPTGYLFYDAELTLGGPGNWQNIALSQSNVQLQLEYWNGHNYQMITNAYNFGSDTAEGISNTLSQSFYYPSTGTIIAIIQPGAGSLGKLYDQSTLGIIDIKSYMVSGTLSVTNASNPNAAPWQTPFANGEVTITIIPGYYNLKLYQNGLLYDQVNCTVTAGQSQSLQVTSITMHPAGVSTPLSVSNNFAVSSTLGGHPQVSYAQDGTLTFTADSSSNVVISGVSNGSIFTGSQEYGNLSIEEWVLNSQGTNVTLSAGSNTTFYYYDVLSQQVAYWGPNSGNSISPILTYYTAPLTSSSQSNPTATLMSLTYFWQQAIMVLRGTTVSISNNILGMSQDRWGTPITTWNISQTNQIPTLIIYFHQYQVTPGYSTSDGSVSSSNLTLSGIQYGSNYQLSLTTTNQTTWLDANTTWSVPTIITAPSGIEQWVCSTGISGNITGAITINPNYIHQYYLAVISTYGNPLGQGWYNAGNAATFNASSPVSGGSTTQYMFAGWSGSGSGSYSGTNISQTVTMNNSITETTSWTTQYYLNVSSSYTSTNGSGWYNSGASTYAGLSSGIVSNGTGTQYVFSSWSTGGTSYAQSNAINMSSPVTATASWQTQYQIVPSADSNSVINPSSAVWVNAGSSQTCTYSANSGCTVNFVLVDGSSIPITGSYTFNNIQANHAISITSALNPTIIASAGTGGSISPSGSVNVNYGSSQNYSITANNGYYIVDVAVNGSSIGAVSSYTFNNVQGTYTISATFAPNPTPTPTQSPTPTPTATPYPTLIPIAAPTSSPTPTASPTPTIQPTVKPEPETTISLSLVLYIIVFLGVVTTVTIATVTYGRRKMR